MDIKICNYCIGALESYIYGDGCDKVTCRRLYIEIQKYIFKSKFRLSPKEGLDLLKEFRKVLWDWIINSDSQLLGDNPSGLNRMVELQERFYLYRISHGKEYLFKNPHFYIVTQN